MQLSRIRRNGVVLQPTQVHDLCMMMFRVMRRRVGTVFNAETLVMFLTDIPKEWEIGEGGIQPFVEAILGDASLCEAFCFQRTELRGEEAGKPDVRWFVSREAVLSKIPKRPVEMRPTDFIQNLYPTNHKVPVSQSISSKIKEPNVAKKTQPAPSAKPAQTKPAPMSQLLELSRDEVEKMRDAYQQKINVLNSILDLKRDIQKAEDSITTMNRQLLEAIDEYHKLNTESENYQ